MDNYNLWYDIFNFLDFKSQLSLIFTSNMFKNNLSINNLYDIDEKYSYILTDNILQRGQF